MKNIKYLFVFIAALSISKQSLAQLDSVYHQGPSTGIVNSGALQTTDNFGNSPMLPVRKQVSPYLESPAEPPNTITNKSSLPPYVYIEDLNTKETTHSTNGQTVLLQKFPGHSMTNWIPPDPIIAVGPNHIITCVNSEFNIWDKEGNLLKAIQAEDWWAPVWPEETGDPQVIYDHYAGRWVLSWMQVNLTAQTAGNLIAYSDDDNPLGIWYVYRLDATKNGSITSNTWGDYPQLGFDDEAIYISTRCFTFTGYYQYNKIRLINKSEFYSSNGGALTYKDFWNIRRPLNPYIVPDGIHPTYCYTAGEGGYFFMANGSGGDYYIVYKIIFPLSVSPRLRGSILNVQSYYNTPNANQLGGGMPISSNGSSIKTAPIVRDGKMYVTHSIGNSTNQAYASIKYLVYSLTSNSIIEQSELGAIGYYYIYPTITVDKDHNIALTFSRSADTMYIGSYYATKQATSPPGLSPSQLLAEGQGNYVVTYGGPRNRWGDYLGIYLDPNEYDVWIFPEYAAATNTWGTYVGQIRMAPYQGPHIYANPEEINFGIIEVGQTSSADTVILSNYGNTDVIISEIPSSLGDFNLLTNLTFPLILSSYDSLILEFNFTPTETGQEIVNYFIISNDTSFTGLNFIGYGNISTFQLSVDVNSGWNMVSIPGLHPVDQNVSTWWPFRDFATNVFGWNNGYYIVHTASPTQGYWMKHSGARTYNTGDEWPASGIIKAPHDTLQNVNGWKMIGVYECPVAVADIQTIPPNCLNLPVYGYNNGYQIVDTLYPGYGYYVKGSCSAVIFPPCGTYSNNKIVKYIDDDWGKITITDAAGISYTLYAVKGEVDLSQYELPPAPPAGMFDIRYESGRIAEDINSSIKAIDMSGVTYPLTVRVEGMDIRLMDETGKIVNVNLKDGEDIVISDATISKLMVSGEMIPAEYALEQNYPNPFNPSTVIEFSLPEDVANVKLSIYNALGEKVAELVNTSLQAGRYQYQWNAENVATGIYIYELRTDKFVAVKKMVLMK